MLISKDKKRGEKSIWQCDVCGKRFEITASRAGDAIKKNHKKFCSKKCLKYYQVHESSKRVVSWIKNNRHPNFRGGCGITTDGYVEIYIKGYPHNKIKLHRYLMEVKLGRKLKSEEIVHHINFDKFDNQIENLQIVSRAEHNRIHNFLSSKLVEKEVLEIRKKYKSKNFTLQQLADEYNVRHQSIGSIVNRKTWKHI